MPPVRKGKAASKTGAASSGSSSGKQHGALAQLPLEVLARIFSHLEMREIVLGMSRVCKSWNAAAKLCTFSGLTARVALTTDQLVEVCVRTREAFVFHARRLFS